MWYILELGKMCWILYIDRTYGTGALFLEEFCKTLQNM